MPVVPVAVDWLELHLEGKIDRWVVDCFAGGGSAQALSDADSVVCNRRRVAE